MASVESYRSASSGKSPTSGLSQLVTLRRQSSIPQNSPTITSPRVQLVPHSRTSSYDASFSPSDLVILSNTQFDSKDLSSKDFDFEDVFTYDKPQKKLKSIVEVSTPSREWANFTSSHYQSAVSMRQKYNNQRARSNAAEMLMKNQDQLRRKQ